MRQLSNHLIQNSQLWLRPLLIIGLLLISGALTYIPWQSQATLILFALLGVGVVLFCLRWPSLGLVVAPMAGMAVPYLGPGGVNVTMILVVMLFGLWLLDMVARQHQIRLAPSRAVWPLLSLVVIAFVSFGVGQLPWFTFALHAPLQAQVGGLSIIVMSVGTCLLAANRVPDLSGLSKMTWAFLAFGALYIAVRSLLPVLGLPTRLWLQSAGSVFYIWLVAIAFSQAAFNRDLKPGWRLALGGLVLATLFVLLYQKFADKSGWLPVLICIAAIIGFRSWRAGLVLVLLGGLAALYLAPKVFDSEAYSVSTRFDALIIMFQIIKISPIWGLGFANYYWYTPLFPIRGYAVSFNSHNNYVDIVAQTGFVGLVCLLWFFAEVGRLGYRLRERVPAGFAQAYVYGALGGLVGTVVVATLGDWVLPFVYNIGLSGFRTSMLAWLFLGGLISLEQMKLFRTTTT